MYFQKPDEADITNSSVEDHILAIDYNAVAMLNHNVDPASLKESRSMALEQIQLHAQNDPEYQSLVQLIHKGFPLKKSDIDPKLKEYWEVRERLNIP